MTTLPLYPRLNSAIRLLTSESGVVVDGLSEILLIRGIVAETVIPFLIPHLNGEHTVEDLVDKLPSIPEGYIRTALTTLAEWGLLEDGKSCTETGDPYRTFVLRHQLSFSSNSFSLNAIDRLTTSEITIETNPTSLPEFAAVIEPFLHESFIKRTVFHELSSAEEAPGVILRATVQNEIDGSQESIAAPLLQFLLLEHYNRLLFCSVICSRATRPSCCDFYYDSFFASASLENISRSRYSLVASLVTSEIVDIILKAPHALVGRTSREFDFDTLVSTHKRYPRSSSCRGCCGDELKTLIEPAGHFNIAWAYNERLTGHTSGRPRIQLVPRRDEPQGKLSDYVGPHVSLPSAGVNFRRVGISTLASASCSSIWMRPETIHLAALCAFSAGIRERTSGATMRWAPSAGNLGATRVYLLASGINTLASGVYSYDPESHSFRPRLMHQSVSADTILNSLGFDASRLKASALLVYSARREILRPKYGSFSYKLGFLDGGCALAQARFVATAMDLPTNILMTWPDSVLSDGLGLPAGQEHITSVLAIGDIISQLRNRPNFWYASDTRTYKASQLYDLSDEEVTDLIVKAAETTDRMIAPSKLNEFARQMPRKGNHTARLPQPAINPIEIDEVLMRRRSTRTFDSSPISDLDLGSILASAVLEDESGWSGVKSLGLYLGFYVICRCVDGIPAGIYRYEPNRKTLAFVASLPSDSVLAEMYVQTECRTAAATVIITGDVTQAVNALGAFGYRHILVRAGAAGQMMSLAALSRRLGTAVLAGIVPAAAYKILNICDLSSVVLFASVVGQNSENYDAFGD